MENLKLVNGWEDTEFGNVVIKEFDNFYVVMGNMEYDSGENGNNNLIGFDRVWKDDLGRVFPDEEFDTVEDIIECIADDFVYGGKDIGALFVEDTEENINKKMNWVMKNMTTEDDYYDIINQYAD